MYGGLGKQGDTQAHSSQTILGKETAESCRDVCTIWLQTLLNRLIFLGGTSTMLFLLSSFLDSQSYKSWMHECPEYVPQRVHIEIFLTKLGKICEGKCTISY